MSPPAFSTPTEAPEFLQLAAHPLRWRLLGELARSDRTVQELTGSVGEAQNLVSYHLAKLRGGGLVSSHRSSADRRDTYYGLDLARMSRLIADAGGALHPGLRLAPPQRDGALAGAFRVLFLCTGNSARSQMAEALARAKSGGAIEAFSAGSDPKPLSVNAVHVMREEFDLDIAGQVSKHVRTFDGEHFDWVVTLCDRVREVCPEMPGHPRTTHWSIANPATGEPDDVTLPLYQQTAEALATRIDFLIAALAAQPQGRSQ